MCKYYPFKATPPPFPMCKSRKASKPTSIGLPKKLWVKISSKKFRKDPIKYEQIFIPKDNVLYNMKIFIPNDVFRDWSV